MEEHVSPIETDRKGKLADVCYDGMEVLLKV